MPKATVRANARTLPDAHHEDLRPQVADAREAPVEKAERETTANFDRAYSAWLAARARSQDPSVTDDDVMAGCIYAEFEAERQLMTVRAMRSHQVWKKLEAFEAILSNELSVGRRANSILMLALGSIKADFLNLDLHEEATR